MYSFSGLSTSDPTSRYGCWFKFYCRYVLELKGVPGPALTFGKACHSIIETAIKSGSTEDLSMCSRAISSALELDLDEVLKCVTADPVLKAIETDGEVEEYFEMPLEEPFGNVLRGFIDFHRVDDKVYLTDWKTNQRSYKPTDNHQLGLYAAYLRQKYNKPVVGRLVFLRFNWYEEHEYTDEDIEKALDWAINQSNECDTRKRRFAKGEDPLAVFPKSTGSCEWCEYASFCLSETKAIPEVITTTEDALETAEGILQIEEALKIRKAKLKTFLEKSGPLERNGIRATVEKNEYLKFDLSARKAVCNKILADNLDIGSILKIGSDAQKDLMTKHGWTEQDFIALGAKKGATSRLVIGR
jgi:hypothetical protein